MKPKTAKEILYGIIESGTFDKYYERDILQAMEEYAQQFKPPTGEYEEDKFNQATCHNCTHNTGDAENEQGILCDTLKANNGVIPPQIRWCNKHKFRDDE